MFYFDATCTWLLREFKSIEIDRYQRCNNTNGEPRNGAIGPISNAANYCQGWSPVNFSHEKAHFGLSFGHFQTLFSKVGLRHFKLFIAGGRTDGWAMGGPTDMTTIWLHLIGHFPFLWRAIQKSLGWVILQQIAIINTYHYSCHELLLC